MFGIGWGELALIFLLVLILFGPKQAQAIFRAFGRGIKEFKDAIKGLDTDTRKADFQGPAKGKDEGDNSTTST